MANGSYRHWGHSAGHGIPALVRTLDEIQSGLLDLSKEDGALFLMATSELGLLLQLSQHLSLRAADLGALGRLSPAGVFIIKDGVMFIQVSNNNFLVRRG